MYCKGLELFLDFSDSNPNSAKGVSIDERLIEVAMTSAALYWTDSNISQFDTLEVWP